MKNWFTIHDAHPNPDWVKWDIYLQDKYEFLAQDIEIGDRVFIYEAKTSKQVRFKDSIGKMGLVHVGHVTGSGGYNPREEAEVVYTDGDCKSWGYSIPTDAGSSEGFVSRNQVVRVLDYKDNYYFKGFAGGKGVKEIGADQADELQALFDQSTKSNFGHDEYFDLFQLSLDVDAIPFGQTNKSVSGISDGNTGVQWNLAMDSKTGQIRLGVNLEGMKYTDWPIRKFIFSELCNSKILGVSKLLPNPDDIYIRFRRDAWQVTSRPAIIEQFLGGKELSFGKITLDRWEDTLVEALDCLDKTHNYRGRATQTVTLASMPKNGDQVREMEVSPHLNIWTPLANFGNKKEIIARGFEKLEPAYRWVQRASEQAGAVK